MQGGGGQESLASRGDNATTSTKQPKSLLTPGEVARMFGVDPKTVSRWADAGKLGALRTLGGHRRYRAHEVHSLLAEDADA